MRKSADPLEMLQRFVGGDTAPEVLHHLRVGFGVYLKANGALTLERCLRLPNTPNRRRLEQRNAWLRHAAWLLDQAVSRSTADVLANELNVFITRGPWRHWRDRLDPPSDADRLCVALFHVARLNRGKPLSDKQICRVIGHGFNKTCPTANSMICSIPNRIEAHTSSCIHDRSSRA